MLDLISALYLLCSITSQETLPPIFEPHIPTGEELQERQKEEQDKYKYVPRDQNGNELA